MRHILIILSLLLLTSPLFGDNHKGETLYRWETSSGYVWKGFGDKVTHRVYKGEWKNGEPNGLGVITYRDGHKYVGEFKDGKKHGQGTHTYSDGRKYVGEWKDGKKNGQGTYTWSDGDKEVGEWKKNELWNGTMYDKDGNIIKRVVNGVKQ